MAIQGFGAAHNTCSKPAAPAADHNRVWSPGVRKISKHDGTLAMPGSTDRATIVWVRVAVGSHGCHALQHILLLRCSTYVRVALFLERFLPKLGPPVRWRPLFLHCRRLFAKNRHAWA